eukprot:GEZU01036211.1.p1 GENE.GEZU01036211.1~~GEZU01036211.1.p1  ORF type:complete len:655 (+),score=146.92 GEZU01036211.1:67-2031(+)
MSDFEQRKKDEIERQRKKELDEKRERLRLLKEKGRGATTTATVTTTPTPTSSATAVVIPRTAISPTPVSAPLSVVSPTASTLLSNTFKTTTPAPVDIDSFVEDVMGTVLDRKTTLEDELRKQSELEAQKQKEMLAKHEKELKRKKMAALSIQRDVAVVEIKPYITEFYDKEVQTTESFIQTQESTTTATGGDDLGEAAEVAIIDSDSSLDNDTLRHGEQRETTAGMKTYSAQQVKEILSSKRFEEFFMHSSLLVERALNQPFDVLIDYAEADAGGQNREPVGERIFLTSTFYDEKWSKNRAITSITWSPKHPELCLASYYQKPEHIVSKEPEGVVLLWSLLLPQRPEFTFHCQSPVSNAIFDKFNTHLIIGGTYSGQIVVWDTRAKSTPVQRTPISSRGHTHPIFGMEIIGSANAYNLISLSTDGRLCVWGMDKLTQPQEALDLYMLVDLSEDSKVRKDIAAYTLAFPFGEVNKFFVGSEDGAVYSAHRHGSKSGVNEKYEGHFAPITGMDFHPPGPLDGATDLLLTSSMDWTVKLWTQKSTRPIFSFEEYEEYVYDVKWSPVHPALFATVDGTGRLLLWNINENCEVPVLVTEVGNRSSALNHLRWSADGRKIVVGNSTGYLYVYEVDKDIALPQPDEWKRLEQKLAQLSAMM